MVARDDVLWGLPMCAGLVFPRLVVHEWGALTAAGPWLGESHQASVTAVGLAPVWAALAGTFTVAVTVLTIAMWSGFVLLGVHGLKPETKLSSRRRSIW